MVANMVMVNVVLFGEVITSWTAAFGVVVAFDGLVYPRTQESLPDSHGPNNEGDEYNRTCPTSQDGNQEDAFKAPCVPLVVYKDTLNLTLAFRATLSVSIYSQQARQGKISSP